MPCLVLLLCAVCLLCHRGQGQRLMARTGVTDGAFAPALGGVRTPMQPGFSSSLDQAELDQTELDQTALDSTPLDSIAYPRLEATTRLKASPGAAPQLRQKPAQELIVEGLLSYGNYRIFASGYDEKLFTAGIEYDRHSWGYFLKAQVDYVAEFLPFILLDKPLHTDIYGNPVPKKEKNIREYVPGIGISPIGFRLQWRNKKAFKPYMEAKGGMVGFTKKVPSTAATYENFSLQSALGVQVKMTDRWGLRLGLFSDFHFSNDFIVPVDPGLDVMNANLGVSYHF